MPLQETSVKMDSIRQQTELSGTYTRIFRWLSDDNILKTNSNENKAYEDTINKIKKILPKLPDGNSLEEQTNRYNLFEML